MVFSSMLLNTSKWMYFLKMRNNSISFFLVEGIFGKSQVRGGRGLRVMGNLWRLWRSLLVPVRPPNWPQCCNSWECLWTVNTLYFILYTVNVCFAKPSPRTSETIYCPPNTKLATVFQMIIKTVKVFCRSKLTESLTCILKQTYVLIRILILNFPLNPSIYFWNSKSRCYFSVLNNWNGDFH